MLALLAVSENFASEAPQQSAESMKTDSVYTVEFYFRFNRSLLEKGYMTNDLSFEALRRILTDPVLISEMDSISIQAAASPEGPPASNEKLANARAAAVKSYLMWKYPFLDREKIVMRSLGENWEGLRRLVEADEYVPYKRNVLDILDSDLPSEVKDARLKSIGNGSAFAYLFRHIFPHLRTGAASVIISRLKEETEHPVPPTEEPEVMCEDTLKQPQPVLVLLPPSAPVAETPRMVRPMALKTNLLYDAVSVLNIEAEIPVGRRFSVAAEWTFPWWLWTRKQHSLEIISGNIEGRYWFKPDFKHQNPLLGKHNPMTGWFAGVYGNAGKYDLEWSRKGHQGEFFSAGVTVGYVKPLSKSLNMEFSLGLGYLKSDYRKYNAHLDDEGEWHLIKQYNGKFTWIGPTKAKIALVWYPHFKLKQKGGNK